MVSAPASAPQRKIRSSRTRIRGFCQEARSAANICALFVIAGQIHQHRVALPLLLKSVGPGHIDPRWSSVVNYRIRGNAVIVAVIARFASYQVRAEKHYQGGRSQCQPPSETGFE